MFRCREVADVPKAATPGSARRSRRRCERATLRLDRSSPRSRCCRRHRSPKGCCSPTRGMRSRPWFGYATRSTCSRTDIERLEQRVDAARDGAGIDLERDPRGSTRPHSAVSQVVCSRPKGSCSRPSAGTAAAITGYEHAVAAELIALADAGIESYASFLLAVEAADDPANARARRSREAELAAARARVDDALASSRHADASRAPGARDANARPCGATARVPPGSDPAAELRALRVPTEGRVELLDEIADVLRRRGIVVTGDVVDHARVPGFVAASRGPRRRRRRRRRLHRLRATTTPTPPHRSPSRSRRTAPTGGGPSRVARRRGVGTAAVRARPRARATGYRSRGHRRGVQRRSRRARSGRPVSGRRGAAGCISGRHLLAGQLPLVLDGALDGLGAAAREAAVKVLAAATTSRRSSSATTSR